MIGENPASSEADVGRARKLMGNLDTLIVQDLFMTKTAEMADVVLPASNAALESEGSVTNSERRFSASARFSSAGGGEDDIWIIAQLREATRRRLGRGHAALGVGRAPARLADARRDDERAAGRG